MTPAHASDEGFAKPDDGALAVAARNAIDAHPAAVADYRNGKVSSVQFLLGQAMRELKGQADPVALKNAIEEALNGA